VLSLVCERFGSHRDLVLQRLPRAPLPPASVRLRVAHATLSFGQSVMIAGQYQRTPSLPFVPGTEVSGTVIETGAAVTHLAPGDRVVAALDWGGYAQEAIATAVTTWRIPEGIDLPRAACLPLTYGTAHSALHWRARLRAGDTVLVLGAAGGVGLAAVEVARAGGAMVIATGSTEDKRALALERGAHHALPADAKALREAVLALTAGRGVDIVFDPVGGALGQEALRCVAAEGRYLVIGFASGEVPRTAFNVLLVKNVEVIGFWFGIYIGWGRTDERQRYAPAMQTMMDALCAGCLQGQLRPQAAMRFPLERYVDAFDAVTGRQGRGRVLFDL
jgi:NADPH2:quinone reductase